MAAHLHKVTCVNCKQREGEREVRETRPVSFANRMKTPAADTGLMVEYRPGRFAEQSSSSLTSRYDLRKAAVI